MYYIVYEYYDKRHYRRSRTLSLGSLNVTRERYMEVMNNKNINLACEPDVFLTKDNKRTPIKFKRNTSK